ncbi:hypothetical protein [Trichothermofontia sp.]
MNSETLQWLTEIQALQQQVMVLQAARDEMAATAQRWQKLYETEAQQRRSDAAAAQATIAQLRADLAAQSPLGENGETGSNDQQAAGAMPTWLTTLQAQGDRAQTLTEAQAAFQALWLACTNLQQRIIQLSHNLAVEQAAHQQTRKTLTLALGDTIDLLTQERQKYGPQSIPSSAPSLV